MSEKLLTDLRSGRISGALAENVQLYLAPALSSKPKTSQKLDKHGLLSMRLLRGCIQVLGDGQVDSSNIGHIVQIATDAYNCVQKTRLYCHPKPLALEKLIYHISSQLLKGQFFADALTFVGHLKGALRLVDPDTRDNEYNSICKQVYNQLWNSSFSLQEGTKQPTAKYGLILTAQRLALSTLLLTNHDRKWISDRFVRVSVEFEHKTKNDPERYAILCEYFRDVVDDILNYSDLKSRLKEATEEEDVNGLMFPLLELTVQYTKCSIFGRGQTEAMSACEALAELFQSTKMNCDTGTSLIYARATLSLLKVILDQSLPEEKASSAKSKRNRKAPTATSKSDLLNVLAKDLQGVRKVMEKEEHRILAMTSLAEGLDLYRKTNESRLGQGLASGSAQSDHQALSMLRLAVEILVYMRQYYLGCEEGDKALGGRPVSQLHQRCIGRLLSALSLMSTIHLRVLREVTNDLDMALVEEGVWVVQRADELLSDVSEGRGGSLSIDEHRWLGNVSYNLGLILYQKQVYDTAEVLVLLSNRHFIHWCTLKEHLQMDRIQKVNLWHKLELQLDCQRRLNRPDSALETIATVLLHDLKEPGSGVQRSKWLELWWKVKRDLTKDEGNEELRSRTIFDTMKDIEPTLPAEFLAPLSSLLEEELKLYEQQRHDTLQEEYAVVCDLLALYQCDDYLPERALILIKLSHLLRTGRLESENTPEECVDTAISLMQDKVGGASTKQHQLEDILAQAYFWSYICSSEKLTTNQKGDEEVDTLPLVSASWDLLAPLQFALSIWESMSTDLRFSAGVLKHPRRTLFCLRKMADVFGLQQLPLLQLRALSTAVLLFEAAENDQSRALDLCSLARVLAILGLLDDAGAALEKANALVPSANGDAEPFVRCTVNLTGLWLCMYKNETKTFESTFPELLESTDQMRSQNFNRYFIEAETKLMLAWYTATSVDIGLGDRSALLDQEIDLDLSPVQPAQEAMRLFTAISKGVMDREFDGNVDQQGSLSFSHWSALQRVLDSLLLVGELYTLQGCVREAKYYFQEGLSLCQLYGLPRWVATFNLHLCESYILQGSEESSLACLKAVETVIRGSNSGENNLTKPKVVKGGNHRLSSADESMDDSFVLHTRKMSLSDLCDDSLTTQSPLIDLLLPTPSFVSHKRGCECNQCSDFELHRSWIHLYALAANVVGVGHKHFDCLLSQGEALWSWSKSRWDGNSLSALENISLLTPSDTKESSICGRFLTRTAMSYAKVVNLRAVSQLNNAEQYSSAARTIAGGLVILELPQLEISKASTVAGFLYLKALTEIYRLDDGGVKASLDKLVASSWSELRSMEGAALTEGIAEQMSQLSLGEATGSFKAQDPKEPATPTRWVDSWMASGTYSRPELARKQARGETAKREDSLSNGLLSDITDEDGEEPKVLPKMKRETTTAKKKRTVLLKPKKGSLFIESAARKPSVDVFVDSAPSPADVFAFDEVCTETKPKRGRGRKKKETETPKTLPKAPRSARPRRGKVAEPKEDFTDGDSPMEVEVIEDAKEIILPTKAKLSKAKEPRASKVEDSKSRKPTRRRGRPAATEKVREDLSSVHLDGGLYESDESFCDLTDGQTQANPPSPAVQTTFLPESLMQVRREEEANECPWPNIGDQFLACEEIEIPRALSEEEECAAPKRRARRGAGKRGTTGKRGAPKPSQKENEPTDDSPEESSGGIDSVIKTLEEALRLIRTTAPCPTYRKICQLLALCLGEKQSQRAADYLSEATSVTLRHQKLTSLVKKLRRQKHSEESESGEDGDKTAPKRSKNQSLSSKSQRLLASSKLFSFRSENNSVKEVVELLPKGWVVCQLSVVDVVPSSPGFLTETSRVILTRLQRGNTPLVVHLPLVDSGPSKKSAEDLMSEFEEIFLESKETVKTKEKVVWWASRQSLNDQLRDLLESFEQVFFGCWKGLLLGQVKDESLREEVEEAVRVYARLCGSLSAKEVHPQMCEGPVNAAAHLSRQDLVQALAPMLGLPVGTDDLSQAISAFQDVTEDISPKLKSPTRFPTILILDKQLQHIPWESTPTLRQAPVFRMPSLHFLRSSLLARSDPGTILQGGVDTERTSFVLNPSKDLTNTQKIFQDWFEKLQKPQRAGQTDTFERSVCKPAKMCVKLLMTDEYARAMLRNGFDTHHVKRREKKWQGVTGRVPSKEEYTAALTDQDLFIYCGHGNGREYFSGDEIERLTCRAATLLIGCSSGKLTVNGCLDAKGMVLSYIVAECPCIVANLWDVTDRDIDRFLENLLKAWLKSDREQSLLDFIAEARNTCRLQYLIGSAPVMYGLPVHLVD